MIVDLSLKETLLRERAKEKGKDPFSPSLFAHVGGLVRRHRLGGNFTRALRELTPEGVHYLVQALRRAPKPPYLAPLFFLATWEEYQEIIHIMAAAPNPYLIFACNPEEILLSGALYDKYPELSRETLASRHFATLF